MKNQLLTIISLFVLSMVIIHSHKVRSEIRAQYAVACIEAGYETDVPGENQLLQGYYHISHTPQEGGRCYFKFPKGQAKCMSQRQAQAMQEKYAQDVTYSSESGATCYLKDKELYGDLVSKLKKKPSISRTQYGTTAPVYKSWAEVLQYLESEQPSK